MFWGEQQAVVAFVTAACIFSARKKFAPVVVRLRGSHAFGNLIGLDRSRERHFLGELGGLMAAESSVALPPPAPGS